jgi:competence protein ComEC
VGGLTVAGLPDRAGRPRDARPGLRFEHRSCRHRGAVGAGRGRGGRTPPFDHNSIGIGVQHSSFSVLLTGDGEVRERALWEENVPDLIRDCTVLKLAHQGSRNGTDARWLGIVRPHLAVASLGKENGYGHPHPQTLALLARHEIPLLRTDLDGTVTMVSDGKVWEVSSHKSIARGPPDPGERLKRVAKTDGQLIDINTATEAELESLPGVGPLIARKIIDGRPYGSVDELLQIKGIGIKRLAEIRPLATAR